jgi:PST family polysaccharide transporter
MNIIENYKWTTHPLIKNFISLTIVQIANYIFPLISLPYLVRVLGPEKYGLISFAQSFIGYFILITNYGFDLSATREISINRDQKEKLSEIFNSVMYAKFILLFSCFLILLSLLQLEKFRSDYRLYIFTFGIILGQTLFPLWLFMGLERMKYITVFVVLERAVYTICIFIFIKRVNDYIYVPLLNTAGYMTSGILSLGVTLFYFKIKIKLPEWHKIWLQIKRGWDSFVATICFSLYSTSNTFILGLFSNNTIVGYYSAAEKLIYAVQRMLVPLSQTVYPYISKKVEEEKMKSLRFIKKIFYINFVIGLLLFFVIFLGANILSDILLGPSYKESIYVIRIFALLPLVSAILNVLGFQTMLPFKMDKILSRTLFGAAMLNIVFAFILIPIFKHIGAAIAYLLTMISACLALYLLLKRKNINILA